MRSFGQYTDSKQNNFNLLRLCAALIVLYTHSYGLSGQYPNAKNAPIAYFIGQLGNVGVHIFFLISGFLVTRSYMIRNNIIAFIWARVLRIYPALFCAVLFSALIVGCYASALSVQQYFQEAQVYQFILINLSLIKTELVLPEVFNHNVVVHQVNGSLWTLPAEVRLYLYVAMCGVLGMFISKWKVSVVAILIVVLYLYKSEAIPLIADNVLYYYPALFFLLGSLFYIYKDYIPAYGVITLILMLTLVYCVFTQSPMQVIIYTVFLMYSVFWCAYNLSFLNVTNYLGDYSYGLYVYAFPIQQLIISQYPLLSVDYFFFYSVFITLVLAIFSWHVVEKPILRFK